MAQSQVVNNPYILVVTPEPATALPEQLLARLEQQGFALSVLGVAASIPWSRLEELEPRSRKNLLLLFVLGSQSDAGMAELGNLIRRLRSVPQLRAVPVIAAGEDRDRHLWRAAIHAGALDYLAYSATEEEWMQSFESASARQHAIFVEVQRQVEERYHDIIGIIQHEFRTPMTLLLGYSEYLREALEGQMDYEELSISVEAILSGSQRLHRLIEGFLLLSDLQYRHPDALETQNVAPEILWREAQAILRAEAKATGLQITLQEPENHASMAGSSQPESSGGATMAEPELVREALTRLLDNALRYIRPESQHITLSVSTDERWTCWIIEDEGPGMEQEALDRILAPMGRTRGNRYVPQSVGLSLAIVKRIAELHGGELLVESRLNQGSRFTLRIPRGNSI